MRAQGMCAALLVVLIPSGASAQSVVLTESEFLSHAMAATPRVQAIRSSVDLARADVLAAGRWPNPRLSWNREAVAGITEHILSVSQPLPITGRRELEVRAASALVEASSERADEEIRRLRADARLAFAEVVAAQAREQALAETASRLRELASLLARRESAGESSGFDRVRVEREVVEMETQRSLATVERVRARAALSGFLTTPLAGDVMVVATPAAPREVPTVEALVATAELTRLDLAALAQEARAATLAADAAGRRLVPEPEVVAGMKSSSAGGGDRGSVFAVHASIPLFDRAQPERAAARARATQAISRGEALRVSLRAEITALHDILVERRGAAERHRLAMPESVDRIERIAQVSYDAGERGVLDLLDVYRTTVASRAQQLALDAAVRATEIELEFVSGWEAR
jgi:cobalt-zinc-cadmium efflux system outer membrane protein